MAQLKKKFLSNDSVGGTKILLENNTYQRSRNAANSADVNLFKLNASDVFEFGVVPTSPSDATTSSQLVRYSQFVSALEGMKPKASVVTVALSNINLAVASTPNPVGGYTVTNNQRVLLAFQTAPAENGIYVAVTAIDPTTWVRADDYNAVSEIPGSYTGVQFGTEAGNLYLTTSTPTILGTDAINFIKKAADAVITTREYERDLDATDITNQYIDLPHAALGASASVNSVSMFVIGAAGISRKAVHYSVSLTGGVAGVTRLSFLDILATGGVSELDATDFVLVQYSHI